MADAMEVPFDGDLVETEFNEILEDYLNMQGRSDSDEGNSDYDVTDDSSSANDSYIGHAISADIVGDGVVEPPLQPRPGSDTPARPTASTSSDSHSGVDGVDVKSDAGCKCPRGECINRFGGGTFFSREQSMPVSTKNSWTCCCSAKCQPSYGEAARLEAKKTSVREI